MIDRSKSDHDIAAGLNIIQAAANLSLIHDLAALTATAGELASDLYAAHAQADADHGTICQLNEQLDAAEALVADRLRAIHEQAHRHAVALRAAQATPPAWRVRLAAWLGAHGETLAFVGIFAVTAVLLVARVGGWV